MANSASEQIYRRSRRQREKVNRPKRSGAPQPRLLVVTIIVAAAMLMVRVNDIWTSVTGLDLPRLELNRSEAQQPPQPGGKAKKNAPAPAQSVNVPPAGSTTPPGADAAGAASAPAGTAATNGSDAAPAAVPGGPAAEGEPPIFTQNEVDVLEKLAARRQSLDGREHDLELRENLIKAAEERIDKKIAEMKAVQGEVQALLKQVDAQDQAKIQSLVKIYETMKPKDAARIFEQLDMPILLEVVQNMKETKVAPVMEAMDAGKAKVLTDAMAAKRAVQIEGQPSANAATSAPAPAAGATPNAAPAAGAPRPAAPAQSGG